MTLSLQNIPTEGLHILLASTEAPAQIRMLGNEARVELAGQSLTVEDLINRCSRQTSVFKLGLALGCGRNIATIFDEIAIALEATANGREIDAILIQIAVKLKAFDVTKVGAIPDESQYL